MKRKNQSNKSCDLNKDAILFKIRIEKINKEIISARKILDGGVEPLVIADKFLHSMILLLKNGILSENPNLDHKSVNKIVRKNMLLVKQIRSFKTE
jgi:hypothetical protein